MPKLTSEALRMLREKGVECFSEGNLPEETILEPPCSLKWMTCEHSLAMGAFSYAVSGYYFHVDIGRYTSIGENVQVGRGDHPVSWLSTSPVFYLNEPFLDIGRDFKGAREYNSFSPNLPPEANPTLLKRTTVGNDVYIGHGAFIRPGVTIGHGAVVGAHAVVVKDVPPYAVVAGNPAAIKKFRMPPHLIGRLLQVAWWRFAPWQIADINIARPEEALEKLETIVSGLEPYDPGLILLRDFASY